MKWTTREGEEIAMSEMKDSHIKNAYKFFESRITYAINSETLDEWTKSRVIKAAKERLLMLDAEIVRRQVRDAVGNE